MRTKIYTLFLFFGVFMFVATLSYAKVTGQCSNCHTMHNSQNGLAVSKSGPHEELLKDTCIGCHTGTNDGTNTTPYVLSTSPPDYGVNGTGTTGNTLAGGNFYWVASSGGANDRCGHNVQGISPPDATLGLTPPGGSPLSTELTCAGTDGCHGNRAIKDQYKAIYGAHHAHVDSGWQDGSTVAKSYRFLLGVQGMEDPKWEYHPDQYHHNKYYGVDRSTEADVSGTISHFCAECHGYFHHGTGQIAPDIAHGVWFRHPTDFDMNDVKNGTEYQYYNGGTGVDNPYSVISPVATSDTSTNLNTVVYHQQGDAIVMCLSCHRAHGSPYPAILRWNYKAWPGPGGYNGCAICHTAKN